MATNGHRLSAIEKIGYGLGDSAANFIFQTMLIFLMSFYTDVFGITAAVAGTLFLVARVTDAIFDFLMGAIADRTETRWGKFRPWVLWTALPFGILGVLTFTTPDLTADGKIVYAYVTYILLMLVYSANNIPYSAMTGVITGDNIERTSVASYRFVCAMTASLLVQGLTRPMARMFGGDDLAKGYQLTMAFFCSLAVVFFVITFVTTKERVRPDPRQKSSFGQDLTDLRHNHPWLALFGVTVLIFLYLSVRGSASPYYFDYYVIRGDRFALNLFGLPLEFELFDLFNICSMVAVIIGIFFSKPLAVRLGKRDAYRIFLFITALFTIGFFWLPSDAVGAIFAIQILNQLTYGVTIPLTWAMMGDVADYSEWRTGRRATGIAFSATVFGLKFGLGVGGALAGWVLGLFGYIPNVAQTTSSLTGIRLLMSIIPAGFALIAVALLFCYKIDRRMEREMDGDLARRREEFQAA